MIRKKIAGSVECGVVTDRRRLRIPDFLVKQGIPRQIKEKQNNDKSAFHLPWQYVIIWGQMPMIIIPA